MQALDTCTQPCSACSACPTFSCVKQSASQPLIICCALPACYCCPALDAT